MNGMVLRELALFSGSGGGLLASRLLGWDTIAACEIEAYPRGTTLQRQRDGMLDGFPIWDNVCTLDGRAFRGRVDVITGGFPCQDISAAGKGAGITGSRSGLWKEYSRIIDEVWPYFVFAENSPLLAGRGLATVVSDLTKLGYGVRWGVLGAWGVGGNHKRDRMWVLAYDKSRVVDGGSDLQPAVGFGESEYVGNTRLHGQLAPEVGRVDASRNTEPSPRAQQAGEPSGSGKQRTHLADTQGEGLQGYTRHGLECDQSRRQPQGQDRPDIDGGVCCGGNPEGWWVIEPRLDRVAHGVANRVERIKAIGNGQVPIVAAAMFKVLSTGLQIVE